MTIVLAEATAPPCPTCTHGCDCEAGKPGSGCGHYCCWGVAPTDTCYDIPRQRAAAKTLAQMFGGAR